MGNILGLVLQRTIDLDLRFAEMGNRQTRALLQWTIDLDLRFAAMGNLLGHKITSYNSPPINKKSEMPI